MQFLEHTDAAGGLILHEFEGEVKIVAAHGLRSPEIVAVSDQVMAAVRTFDTNQRARLDICIQGLGLNNAMDYDQLQRLADLDPLTGIFNRRFSLGRLRVEFGKVMFFFVMVAKNSSLSCRRHLLRIIAERLRKKIEDDALYQTKGSGRNRVVLAKHT